MAGRRIALGSILASWYFDEAAVTLDDVLVFSSESASQNVWLWAHELGHVEQYRRLGIEGFAARYVSDWRRLESEATRRADRATAEIRREQRKRRNDLA